MTTLYRPLATVQARSAIPKEHFIVHLRQLTHTYYRATEPPHCANFTLFLVALPSDAAAKRNSEIITTISASVRERDNCADSQDYEIPA